jgi:ABC-type transport system involved in multi-copper enzyme maturation permease subunit
VLEHARSFWVWTLIVVAVGLTALSMRVHVETLRVKTAVYADLSARRERDRARTSGQVTGWQVEPGLRAIRPPEPLSVVVTGLDGSLPHFWDFSPSGTRAGRVSADSSDIAALGGNVDLEFILRYVLGLLAIGLAVETIAGERASGALLAVLGQPVRPEFVLTGKFAGGLAALGAAVSIVAATAVVAVAVAEPALLTSDLTATIGFVSVAGLLYLFTYFVAGVALASAIPSYRSALIATLIVWILTAVVALPTAGVVAEALSPAPPRSQLEAECEELAQASTAQAQLRMGDVYFETFGNDGDGRTVDRPQVSEPVLRERLEPIWQQYAKESRSELERHRLAAEAAGDRQRQIAHVLARVSPSAQFTAAATNLTGEGDRAAQRWEQATTDYQMTMDRLLFDDRPRLTVLVPYANAPRDSPAGRAIVGFNRRPRPTFETLPGFQHPERTLGVRIADAAPHLAGLTMYAVILVGIAFVAFNRLRF